MIRDFSVHGYNGDYFFLKDGATLIESQPYIPDDDLTTIPYTGRSTSFLDYSNSSGSSIIDSPKRICYVDKNQLLVYGETNISNPPKFVIELIQLANNSSFEVASIKQLNIDDKQRILHSCDYSGGAWFRSINEPEEHAFYNPKLETLALNDGETSPTKLISVVNSKRGHYLCSYWDSSLEVSWLGYCTPESF